MGTYYPFLDMKPIPVQQWKDNISKRSEGFILFFLNFWRVGNLFLLTLVLWFNCPANCLLELKQSDLHFRLLVAWKWLCLCFTPTTFPFRFQIPQFSRGDVVFPEVQSWSRTFALLKGHEHVATRLFIGPDYAHGVSPLLQELPPGWGSALGPKVKCLLRCRNPLFWFGFWLFEMLPFPTWASLGVKLLVGDIGWGPGRGLLGQRLLPGCGTLFHRRSRRAPPSALPPAGKGCSFRVNF